MKKFRTAEIAVLIIGLIVTSIVVLAVSLKGNATPSSSTSSTTPTSVAATTSSTTTTSTTTTTIPQTLFLPKNKHLTILEIGDSLGTDLGGGLGLQLSKSPNVTLIQKSKSETGLANGWFYNWPLHLRQFVAQYHPQLLIVFLGGNDEQGMVVNGHAAAFNTLAWREQYQKNIAQVLNEATFKHCAVLWVGMPIMNPNGYRQGIQVINSLFQKVALTKANVTFLSTWNFMANAKGQFQFSARVNGVVQVLRSADGIHPTSIGQNVIATYVVQQIRAIYHFPVLPAYPDQFTK
ncbi:MAG TPA: DUF459 domain-containing protein [Acidimicrobiales bacterium]